MVSTHPCPSKPELYLRPNNTNASILLCARTLPEHFPTSLLDLSSHALHENSFTIMPTAQRNQRTFTHKHTQYFQLPRRLAPRLNRTPLVAYASHTTQPNALPPWRNYSCHMEIRRPHSPLITHKNSQSRAVGPPMRASTH